MSLNLVTKSFLQLALGQSRPLTFSVIQVYEFRRAEGVIVVLEQLSQKATDEIAGRLGILLLVVEVHAEHRNPGVLVGLPQIIYG